MKTTKLFFLIIVLSFFISTISAEIYLVKRHDTLGQIIKNYFPKSRVFGKRGMLKKIIALNPKIKNIDRIYVNQKIYLPKTVVTAEAINSSIEKKQVQIAQTAQTANEKISTVPIKPTTRLLSADQNASDHLLLKILYGANLTSLDQSKTLTSFNLNTTSSNLLKFESEFKYDDYKLQGSYESHTISIASENSSHEKKLSNFKLQGVWKNFLLGLAYREVPLIKATTTSLELNKESQIGITMGHDKTWELSTTRPTSINLRSTIFIPFKNSSERSDVTFNSISGFVLKSQLEISRAIIKREEYSLNFIWQNELMYESTSRKANWGANSGKINLSSIGASSLIGLAFQF